MDISQVWSSNFKEARDLVDKCLVDPNFLADLESFSSYLIDAYRSDRNLFACGNGGSHCDALHMCEEFTGRYRKDRPPLGALALGEASHLTCVSNDYGFDQVFSRQLEGLAKPGDILVAITTSGNSQNVLEAVQVAKNKGLKTIALTGKSGGKIKEMVDLALVVPSEVTDRIQEMHIKIIHTVIQSVERELFPENYQ